VGQIWLPSVNLLTVCDVPSNDADVSSQPWLLEAFTIVLQESCDFSVAVDLIHSLEQRQNRQSYRGDIESTLFFGAFHAINVLEKVPTT
jgi:hypothetical protein